MIDLFPDLVVKPDTRYAKQDPDETTELLLRRHWFTNVIWISFTLFGLLLPAILVTADQIAGTYLLSYLPSPLLLGIIIVWSLLIFVYTIENFIYWYFNLYLVTNIHIIDIQFYSLFSRQVTQFRLDDIQSVSATTKGFNQTFLRFGDVQIETAAKDEPVVFSDVPDPEFVADKIQELQEVQEKGRKGL